MGKGKESFYCVKTVEDRDCSMNCYKLIIVISDHVKDWLEVETYPILLSCLP